MNYVNLIGKISSEPKFQVLPDGQRIVRFSLSTQEPYLDEKGELLKRKQWHRVMAWGNWVRIMEELGQKGIKLAIEGRLISRYYHTSSGKRQITEVEVNDLVIL
ncbi:MAG: single-stranded DNA-binding protein [Bacteroidetes bacterium]|nr:MAG: single-stranded DNA-binding protein [Bacteroidota bacterium]